LPTLDQPTKGLPACRKRLFRGEIPFGTDCLFFLAVVPSLPLSKPPIFLGRWQEAA
jgi:hypothetical protein